MKNTILRHLIFLWVSANSLKNSTSTTTSFRLINFFIKSTRSSWSGHDHEREKYNVTFIQLSLGLFWAEKYLWKKCFAIDHFLWMLYLRPFIYSILWIVLYILNVSWTLHNINRVKKPAETFCDAGRQGLCLFIRLIEHHGTAWGETEGRYSQTHGSGTRPASDWLRVITWPW